MKIEIIVGTSDGAGRRYTSGQVVDIEDGIAKSWIGHGYAEPVEGEKRTATAAAPRTAAKKTAPSPRKGAKRTAAKKTAPAKKAAPAKKSDPEPTPPAGEDEQKD